jgi:hypothetical protein
MVAGLLAIAGLATVTLAPSPSLAWTPEPLVSFCALISCTDGANPVAGLIADTNGNLFGTTFGGGTNNGGTVFEIAKTAGGYANTPTVLVNFTGENGSVPKAGLIADANGNLCGTTSLGGTAEGGTVFEVVKTATGYANTPITLVRFCSLANCTDGANPHAGLIHRARPFTLNSLPRLKPRPRQPPAAEPL